MPGRCSLAGRPGGAEEPLPPERAKRCPAPQASSGHGAPFSAEAPAEGEGGAGAGARPGGFIPKDGPTFERRTAVLPEGLWCPSQPLSPHPPRPRRGAAAWAESAPRGVSGRGSPESPRTSLRFRERAARSPGGGAPDAARQRSVPVQSSAGPRLQWLSGPSTGLQTGRSPI